MLSPRGGARRELGALYGEEIKKLGEVLERMRQQTPR
jgi:hypothetical protein